MTDRQLYAALGWQILEAKYRYYILSAPTLQDYEYDALEKQYDELADKLGLPKSATDMVDCDTTRPSVQAVAAKIGLNRLSKRS